MRKTVALLLVCLSWAAATRADEAIPPKTHPDSSKWEDLFDKDFSNAINPRRVWYWEDGELTATKDFNIWTKKEYENCIIDLEFKNGPNANSGVFVYGSDITPGKWTHSVEIQILDDYGDKWTKDNPAKKWYKVPPSWKCGGIFGRSGPQQAGGEKGRRVESHDGHLPGPEDLGAPQRRTSHRDGHVEVDLRHEEPRWHPHSHLAQQAAGRASHQGPHRSPGETRRGADLLPQRQDQRTWRLTSPLTSLVDWGKMEGGGRNVLASLVLFPAKVFVTGFGTPPCAYMAWFFSFCALRFGVLPYLILGGRNRSRGGTLTFLARRSHGGACACLRIVGRVVAVIR